MTRLFILILIVTAWPIAPAFAVEARIYPPNNALNGEGRTGDPDSRTSPGANQKERNGTPSGFIGMNPNSELPIDITAGKFHARRLPDGRLKAVYDNDVTVRQGELTVRCDRLVIVYDENRSGTGASGKRDASLPALQSISGITSITASGNVRLSQGNVLATAGKALIDNVKRTITLTEGPRLWHGADMLMGEIFVIYMDENRFEVLSNSGDKRIRTQINPAERERKEP